MTVLNRPLLVALAFGLVLAAPAAADAPPRPPQLGLCESCHGVDGCSRTPGTPHLSAQDETYLRLALEAYREGRRDHPAMRAVSGALGAGDVAALAAWYRALPPCGAP